MSRLTDKLKIVKSAFSRQVLGYAAAPATAMIEVNYDCMLRCKMCQLWTSDFRKKRIGSNKVLSQAEIKDAIDQFTEAGVKTIFFIGGEPFLRKDLLNMIAYGKGKGMTCMTVSNGYLIRDDLADGIVRSGLDVLAVSIDGPDRETHDRIRGVRGAFDHAVQAIERVNQRKKELNSDLPNIAIACTVSSNNFQNLPDMVDLAKDLDVQQVRFQYISVIGRDTVEQTNRMMGGDIVGTHNFVGIPPSYLVPGDEMATFDEMLQEIRKRAGSRIVCHLDPAFVTGDTRHLEVGTFPVQDCKEPWSRAYMTPTGDFMPCPMFTAYSMGNIRNNSFLEIWNSRQARDMRKRLSRGLPPICRKCCVVHVGYESKWKRLYRKLCPHC
jgi:MoaA/NifB/PqqE/SkfB family radical SAM enzyme